MFGDPYRWLQNITVLILLLGASCAPTPPALEEDIAQPPENMYLEAYTFLQARRFNEAATRFEQVEQRHPYSEWARRGQIMAAFAYYRNRSFDQAVTTIDRFIQLHPSDQNIPYLYYLRALCFYEQIVDVRRDQEITLSAHQALLELKQRFPNSPYAQAINLKLDLTTDQLAGKEMQIGRFYLNRFVYPAAINRFRTVITDYQTTVYVPEALHRLTEAYLALGLVQEALQHASVLGHNYPNSQWYQDSYTLLIEHEVHVPSQP